MLDFPIVVLVEKVEDFSKVLGLFLALEVDLVEDVELSPFDLVIVVEIVGLQKFSLDFLSVEVLQVVGVGSSLNASLASLDHSHD